MKPYLLFLSIFLLSFNLSAQQTSQGMRYQAVVRDADGAVIPNESMSARIEMLTMDGTSHVYYEETHEISTNEFGMLNLTIGEGQVSNGDFSTIPWGDHNIWVRTSIKRQNSQTYDIVTTNQLYSVPYAQYAHTAGNLKSQNQSLTALDASSSGGSTWSVKGNKNTTKHSDPPKLGTTDPTPMVFITDDTERMRISELGSIEILGDLDIDLNLAIGQDLSVDGSTEIMGNLDVDSNVNIGQNLYVGNKAVIADSFTVNGPVLFDIEVNGMQTKQSSYPVLIKGSQQGLAIDLTPATDDCLTSHRGNNYVSFWRDGEQKGRIEGMGRADLDPTGLLGMLIDILGDPNEVSNSFGGVLNIDITGPVEDFGSEILNIIEFSPGAFPTLSGGKLPSLSGGSFSDLKFPSLKPGSFPDLTGGMPPNISFNTPMFENPFEGTELMTTYEDLFDNISAATSTGDAGCIVESISPAQTAWALMRSSLMTANLYPSQTDATNFESQIFSNYTLDVLLAGISTLTSAVTFLSSVGSVLDPEDVFSEGVDLIANIYSLVIYGSYSDINLGVAYESGAGDYAEWLHRADPNELIQPGDVVGVIGGRISRKFVHADRFMVVSTSPLLLGNMPENAAEERLSEKVAFVGQVPVKVMGKANIGDYILPSGSGDGIAIAVNPADMLAKDYQRIIGIAWEESHDDGFMHLINTAVGINHNDMAKTIEQMQFTLNHIQAQLKKMDPSYVSHDYEVTIDKFGSSSLDYSVSATHPTKTNDYFENKSYDNNAEILADVRDRMVHDMGIDLSQVPLIDFAFKNPYQAQCLANDYRSILEDMVVVKDKLLGSSNTTNTQNTAKH